MIVASNTSPIMNLAAIGQLNLLERLYGKVLIPEAVLHELSSISSEQSWALDIQALTYIETQSVTNQPLVDSLLLELDRGEAEAIVLAMEMKADLLLIDERRGRKVASRLGLRVIGLLGVLVDSKHRGLIDTVKPLLDDMTVKAGFWVSNKLYDRVLREVEK